MLKTTFFLVLKKQRVTLACWMISNNKSVVIIKMNLAAPALINKLKSAVGLMMRILVFRLLAGIRALF